MKVLLPVAVLILFACRPDLKRSPLQFSSVGIALLAGIMKGSSVSAPSGFSYPSNKYTFANGTAVSLIPSVSGSAGNFSISPNLPVGLAISSSTGEISGAYSQYAGSTADYTVNVTNSAGSAQVSLKLIFFGKFPFVTGQTQCWDTAGTVDAGCTAGTSSGQDGQLQKGTVYSYTGPALVNASDYITTDNVTGLVWKSCNEGLSGAGCASGSVSSLSQASSTAACSALASASYGGKSDWKLPSIDELLLITKYGAVNPSVSTAAFPVTNASGHWTSTVSVANSSNGWYVSFTDGTVGTASLAGTNKARCLSGNYSKSENYIDNGDFTVTDVNTGLVWQQCTNGLSGTGCASGSAATYTWANALSLCNSLSLAGRAWRLPNVNELISLVNHSISSPTINASYFPNSLGGSFNYWTSNTYINTPASAWTVMFGYSPGNPVTQLAKSGSNYVRCVSTGP